MKNKTGINRRDFLKASALAGSGLLVAPTVVKATSLWGSNAPSNRIRVAAIGAGRIARDWNMPGIMNQSGADLVALCDLDSKRLDQGKQFVGEYYLKHRKTAHPGVATFGDYRDMLQRNDIDAVIVSTPDHWHAKIAIDAALAGKHIYLEKPATMTLAEGRLMSNVVHRSGVVFQLGTQQRSMAQFHKACEIVRNGGVGQLLEIEIGLPVDPSGNEEPEMPVPENLNYDMWLGPTPHVYYTEKRVHPQNDYSRPGWLRCRQFCLGMITGWGVHHLDIAHWAMGTEFSGPLEIDARAEYPTAGLWDVHGKYNISARYENNVLLTVSDELPNGLRFKGTVGWIFVSRGNYNATKSDPVKEAKTSDPYSLPLSASSPELLKFDRDKANVQLSVSNDHHKNWLECIRSRQNPISPVEVGHRATSACIVFHAGMQLKRPLRWNPASEKFMDDNEANALITKTQREPYTIDIP